MHVHLLHKRGQPGVDRLEHALVSAGASVHRLASSEAAEIPALLDAAEPRRLIVAGGDGMVHHVAQHVVPAQIPIGIVPGGTGNDIARALRLPRRPAAAAAIALGPVRRLDVMRVAPVDRVHAPTFAVSVLTAGFSGLVNERANRVTWGGGQAKYTLATLVSLPRLHTYRLGGLAGAPTDVSLVAVGNSRFFGGGMKICPAADMTDGVLDTTVVAAVHPLHLAALLPTAFAGQHIRSRSVTTGRFSSSTIHLDSDWWADGEPLGISGTVVVSVVESALTVACELDARG